MDFELAIYIYIQFFPMFKFQMIMNHKYSSNQLLSFKVSSGFDGDLENNFGAESRHLESHAGSRCADLAPVQVRNAPSPVLGSII